MSLQFIEDKPYNCAECKMSTLIPRPDGQVLYCYATKKYLDVKCYKCALDNETSYGDLVSREDVLDLLEPWTKDPNPYKRTTALSLTKAISSMPSAVCINDIYELPDGWLDPCGQMYLSSEYDLSDIVTELRYEDEYDSDGRLLPDDELLYRHGWVAIRFYRNKQFKKVWRIIWERWGNHCHRLTDQQKAFLKPYFEREIVDEGDRINWIAENNLTI